jgi:selenophosphate synthetase-related protein
VPLARWVTAFPSFGYLLSVREAYVESVQARFEARSLACAEIGTVDATREALVHRGDDVAVLWDFSGESFIVPADQVPR